MLLMVNLGPPLEIIVIAVCAVILIHVLLLAGRLVRAVEKIAAKNDK